MESSVSGVGVLDKAIVVLDALLVEPLALAALCEATALPRATAYRLAVALQSHGLVRRLDDGRFTLGLRLIGLGRAAAAGFPLAAVARPILERLRDEVGESVQLYVAEAGGRRCVLSLQSPHGLRWIVPEGVLLPMERGSAGRALAGEVGHSGWVESVEEREKGVCSVSAIVSVQEPTVVASPNDPTGEPVDGISPSPVRIVAAVSISGPIERLSRRPGTRFGRSVQAAAADVAAALALHR